MVHDDEDFAPFVGFVLSGQLHYIIHHFHIVLNHSWRKDSGGDSMIDPSDTQYVPYVYVEDLWKPCDVGSSSPVSTNTPVVSVLLTSVIRGD